MADSIFYDQDVEWRTCIETNHYASSRLVARCDVKEHLHDTLSTVLHMAREGSTALHGGAAIFVVQ